MIDSVGIYRKANSLVQLHGTRDTIKLAEASGVEVVPVDCFNNLLGMYVYRWKHRAMFLNNRMDEYLTLMVAGHELGHDIYHRELAKGDGMKEFELFRMQSSTEYEANAFAAHVLIDTDECLEYAREGYDVVQLPRRWAERAFAIRFRFAVIRHSCSMRKTASGLSKRKRIKGGRIIETLITLGY